MTTLISCDSCAGFLPPGASACPHCGVACQAPRPGMTLGGKIIAGVGTGLVSLTLMACYGGGPCDSGSCGTSTDTASTSTTGATEATEATEGTTAATEGTTGEATEGTTGEATEGSTGEGTDGSTDASAGG